VKSTWKALPLCPMKSIQPDHSKRNKTKPQETAKINCCKSPEGPVGDNSSPPNVNLTSHLQDKRLALPPESACVCFHLPQAGISVVAFAELACRSTILKPLHTYRQPPPLYLKRFCFIVRIGVVTTWERGGRQGLSPLSDTILTPKDI